MVHRLPVPAPLLVGTSRGQAALTASRLAAAMSMVWEHRRRDVSVQTAVTVASVHPTGRRCRRSATAGSVDGGGRREAARRHGHVGGGAARGERDGRSGLVLVGKADRDFRRDLARSRAERGRLREAGGLVRPRRPPRGRRGAGRVQPGPRDLARPDGSEQITYNGHPLYLFSGDTAPGDTTGQGVGDVWYVVDAEGNAVDVD